MKALDKWLPGYLSSIARRARRVARCRRLLLCVCDHFEPLGRTVGADGSATGGREVESAAGGVASWCAAYEQAFAEFRDADGFPPRHTFCYPAEEYAPACVEPLARLTARGMAEVEVHLHHRRDTEQGLAEKLAAFRSALRANHGLLGGDAAGNVRFGFVHGNWALCNSRPDGDWCGVNRELSVLVRAGCYADFTFPSAPSPTQPRMVNAIWRAKDTGAPRAADRGVCVRRGAARNGRSSGATTGRSAPMASGAEELMLISGPLCLDWTRRKFGVLPRIENAELSGVSPPGEHRLRLWTRQGIGVIGRPEWVFVKLHTHGYVPANRAMLFGEAARAFHEALRERWNDGERWTFHYVTAREMYNLARAAEDNAEGSVDDLRNYEIKPPPVAPVGARATERRTGS